MQRGESVEFFNIGGRENEQRIEQKCEVNLNLLSPGKDEGGRRVKVLE